MVDRHAVASMKNIHNGDLVASLARRSSIPGQHIAYRESLITGPVVPGEQWIETRATALSQHSGHDLLRVRTEIMEQEQMLDAAADEGEVVLWFEHDLYCLIHLISLLQRFQKGRLSMVWSPEPLSNNDERALYLLFESRMAVLPSMTKTAREVWEAYTAPEPSALNDLLSRDNPDFPFLREGLNLHASRFPSEKNGLGRIEGHALELIAGGIVDFPSLFDQINLRIPRFGFGDTALFQSLLSIAWCAAPLITVTGELPKALFAITPLGEKVLSGEVDHLSINDPDIWFGGTHLTRENVWRWDGVRLSRSAAS